MVCEVLGRTSLDLVCLDAEHAPFDRLSQDQCLHALRSEGMPSLVRIPSAAPEHILNALDCGASGVLLPHVRSAQAAATAARAAHFGAHGRGYAGSTRAGGYTRKAMADHLADSAAQTVVVAQIENLEALDAVPEIAAVEAIDCLFVGRIDLTVEMGAKSPKEPVVMEAVERICRDATQAGKAVGMYLGDVEEIPHWQSLGASLFLPASDHNFLLRGADRLVQAFRTGQGMASL